MKNKYIILSILLLFASNTIFAQTNYTNGFNTGYKKGYCQDQGVGCIEPIPPIAPIPKVGENSDNYTDGYNRGFQMGLSSRKVNSSNSNSTNRTRYKTAKPKFVDNVMYKAPAINNNYKIKRANEIVEKGIYYLITLEDYDKAINEANKLFNMKVYYQDAYFIKSKAYFHKNELLNSYNFASKINSSNYKEWRTKIEKEFSKNIESLMSYNNYDKVIYNYENMWTQNNSSYYFTGLAYYFKKDYKKAKKYLKKVKKYKPAKKYLESIKNKKYYTNPYTEQKQEVKSSNSNTNSKPNVDLQAIYKLLQNGKYQEGIALIDKSIGNEETELLYEIRGTANYLSNNYSEAISDITKSAKTNKEILPDLLFYRALAKSEVGDFYGAISDYDLLIEKGDAKGQNYDLATVYNNKAYSYVELKQFEEAIPFVTKALKLDKSKWYIWDTRAEIYFNTGEYGKAINDASKAIKIQENANTFFIRGLALIKLNEKALGCKDLSRAGELGKSEAYEEINKNCN